MSYDEDPEVIADLQLRARTVRERGGNANIPTYTPPVTVADWQCRGGCGSTVGVTQDAIDRLEIFNRQLARKSEAPLDPNRIVFCDACKARGSSKAGESNRNKVDRLAGVIRQLKASKGPEQERELMLQAEALGHPDVPGLVQAIRNRLDAKSGSNRERKDKL